MAGVLSSTCYNLDGMTTLKPNVCNMMTPTPTTKPSNEDRATWRKKCRTKMTDHIKTKLGISITPEQVRSRPTADDPYRWRVVPNLKGHFNHSLLQKDLSKHSIGAYRKIYYAIGKSLEAVPFVDPMPSGEETCDEVALNAPSNPERALRASVDELRAEKLRLQAELSNMGDQAAREAKAKHSLEEERSRLEAALKAKENENRGLQQQAQNFMTSAAYSQGQAVKAADELCKTLREDLRTILTDGPCRAQSNF